MAHNNKMCVNSKSVCISQLKGQFCLILQTWKCSNLQYFVSLQSQTNFLGQQTQRDVMQLITHQLQLANFCFCSRISSATVQNLRCVHWWG